MNIFITKISVHHTKILFDKEQKPSHSICVTFPNNHFTMVLTAPMDTTLKGAGVTMIQTFVKERKRLVSTILSLTLVFIYNMLLVSTCNCSPNAFNASNLDLSELLIHYILCKLLATRTLIFKSTRLQTMKYITINSFS